MRLLWTLLLGGCLGAGPGDGDVDTFSPPGEDEVASGSLDGPDEEVVRPPVGPDGDPAPPNILFVLVDDLGIDKVGVYDEGSQPPNTPTIDDLAARGVRFTQAWASPSCSPARASLLTGRYSYRHGIGRWIQADRSPYALSDDETTLPELLARAATPYTSAIVGKWHLVGYLSDAPTTHPLRAGFVTHRGSLSNPRTPVGPRPPGLMGYQNWEKSIDGELSHQTTYMTTDTVDEALDVVRQLPEPWFLEVAFNAPHKPWDPPPVPFPGSMLPGNAPDAEVYDAVVEALDIELGRLLEGIDPKLLQRTMIVFMSDNGTPHEVIRVPLDPERSKETVYEGGVRVPLIMAGAGITAPPGSTSDALVHIVDFVPTFAEIVGLTAADLVDDGGEPLVLDGESITPWMADPAARQAPRVLWTESFWPAGPPPHNDFRWAVRDRDWKLAEQPAGNLNLFDLRGRSFDEGENLLEQELSADAEAAMTRLEREVAYHLDQAGIATAP